MITFEPIQDAKNRTAAGPNDPQSAQINAACAVLEVAAKAPQGAQMLVAALEAADEAADILADAVRRAFERLARAGLTLDPLADPAQTAP